MYRGPAGKRSPRAVPWRDEDDALLRHLRARAIAVGQVQQWFCEHVHLFEAPSEPDALHRTYDALAGVIATFDTDVLIRVERGEGLLLERGLAGAEHAHAAALAMDVLADIALGDPGASKLAVRLRVRALRAWTACSASLRDRASSLAPELSAEQRQSVSDDAAMERVDALCTSEPLHVVAVDSHIDGESWVGGRVRTAMRLAVRTHLQAARARLDALAGEKPSRDHVHAFRALALDVESLHAVRTETEARFVLDVDGPLLSSAVELAWKLYHAKENGLLRQLIDGLRQSMGRLAAVVRGGELAYASRVAQLHVFDAETEEVLDAQFLAVETALILCPTHRNARVVGADLHAHRGHLWLRGGNAAKAREEAEKARALWPENRRLATLDAALMRR